jgi:GNAT superfamily N-acetyltransferase
MDAQHTVPAGMRIHPARSAGEIDAARGLFRAYAEGLGVDLEFQGFEEEVRSLPGAYAPPQGELLLALHGEIPAGCIACRPLGEDVCEMKRLFVVPAFRGAGLGSSLIGAIRRFAVLAGYRAMRLDTLTGMHAAQHLYHQAGFREIPPYYANPLPHVRYFEITLREPDVERRVRRR